jgi:ADP-heptose:LPS heptosyltransferase
MNSTVAQQPQAERMGLVLTCEGMGDCLFALAVIRKLRRTFPYRFDLFTRQPELFRACPYVDSVRPLDEAAVRAYPHQFVRIFETDKLPHWKMDTFDFISVPLGQGQLSFAEKQLEYFPQEPDRAERFDVVLNTSRTWRTRSWPIEHWQRLADVLVARGLKVAVVGKDVASESDKMVKRSPPLEGNLTNLVNALSLDQTYYTLAKARLFVSGQGGLTVLAGATDTEIVVLGLSIEWSKRAIYRKENPFYKVTYVTGACEVYCGRADDCAVPGYDFRCVPTYEQVEKAVLGKLPSPLPSPKGEGAP